METKIVGERLKIAFNYLKKNGKVKYQRDIAILMEMSETTVSRAFSGVEGYCNKQFLLNFNATFSNIFSLKWLMGEDAPMLSDTKLPSQESPSEALIALAASLIQETDRLRHQLTREIEEIKLLKVELRAAIAMLSKPFSADTQDYPSYLAEDK